MLRIDGNSGDFKVPLKFKKKENFKDDTLQKVLSGAKGFKPKTDFENLQPVPMPVDTTRTQWNDNMPLPDYLPTEKKVLTPEEIEKLELL